MKSTITICFIALLSFTGLAQNDAGTANDRDGIVLYIESMPANPYRHMGTVSCSALSPEKIDPMIDHMIKQARKEYEDEFEAMIFRPGKGLCKADVVRFYEEGKSSKSRRGRGGDEESSVDPQKKMSKALPHGGKLVFIQNSPTTEYTLLGKIETPATFRSNDLEELITEIMSVAEKTYPDHDAIVIIDDSDLRKANVIKFK